MIIKNTTPADFQEPSIIHKIADFLLKSGKISLLLVAIVTLLLFLITQTTILSPRLTITPNENFYQDAVTAEITKTGAFGRSEVRFTLDGSDPTSNSAKYEQEILIDSTQTLKIALFRGERQVSPIFVKDFFINTDHQLPIVSISTDPKNLWDPKFGIYVEGDIEEGEPENYLQRGSEWQRPAVLKFYETNGELVLDQEIGLRIHGGGTRHNPQKSFRLYAEVNNNQGRFRHQLFPEIEVASFDTLILRNGGTDWANAFIRDAVIQRVAQHATSLELMPVRPTVLYLNGEYWGLYFLRDRFDGEYFYQRFGVDPDKVSRLEVPLDSGEDRGLAVAEEKDFEEEAELFNRLLNHVAHCRDCANYEQLSKYLDLDNLIEFLIMQLHFSNIDWPYNNTKIWRYQNSLVMRNPSLSTELPVGYNGRFRWLLFDLDVGMAAPSSDNQEDVINSASGSPYGQFIDDKFPWRNLFYNRTFLHNYLNQYSMLLNTGLSADGVMEQISLLKSEIIDEMPRQVARWKDVPHKDGYDFVGSMDEWLARVELVELYAQKRPEAMVENTLEEFYTTFLGHPMVFVSLQINDTKAGAIIAHRTMLADEQLPFEGHFFPQIPLEIEAVANKGYKFVRWEGVGLDEQESQPIIKIQLDQDYKLQAVFEKGSVF